MDERWGREKLEEKRKSRREKVGVRWAVARVTWKRVSVPLGRPRLRHRDHLRCRPRHHEYFNPRAVHSAGKIKYASRKRVTTGKFHSLFVCLVGPSNLWKHEAAKSLIEFVLYGLLSRDFNCYDCFYC